MDDGDTTNANVQRAGRIHRDESVEPQIVLLDHGGGLARLADRISKRRELSAETRREIARALPPVLLREGHHAGPPPADDASAEDTGPRGP